MSQITHRESRFEFVSIAILLLALGTAFAHLYLAAQPDEDLRFWFMLNGIGYLGLLGAFFLPALKAYQGIIRWALLGYTLLTIVLWFFLGSPSEGGPLDPFDVSVKVIEVVLCLLLIVHWRKTATQRA
ncbi:hypothetical protein KDW_18090 [Dictyobacter vulcani]|uniref:Uncharacterized protein n=1 Tax=Dictyobacter vulcani TaxID=2607529 RepID=A0A5J4KMJ1_9CHLR|nr:hypothetical protein [Dictyobacter vulcani]GER87647.1 hypothetical protein KDW_18090 [Dictyobacter vulcani]